MSIGQVAKAAGVKVPTVRHYEEVGLLRAAARSDTNRRLFREEDVSRLRFIRHARELGFQLAAIRQLLALAEFPEEPCNEVDEIARRRLQEIDYKMARLTLLRDAIQSMIENGSHNSIRECNVIDVLAKCDDRRGLIVDQTDGLDRILP